MPSAATGMLHGVGIGIGAFHRWSWGRVALRLAGGGGEEEGGGGGGGGPLRISSGRARQVVTAGPAPKGSPGGTNVR